MKGRVMNRITKMKKGVASFYIVAFSTLVLVVVAASFGAVIVSEITRTSNDDLSQSAYDSALAGVEDAKVAFADYQRCVEAGATETNIVYDGLVTCGEIIYWMNHPDCYMVGHILGRISEEEEAEVPLGITTEANVAGSSDGASVLNQAYTCVVMKKDLPDYKSTITAAHQVRTVKIDFTDDEAKALDHIKLSWYTLKPNTNPVYSSTKEINGVKTGAFQPKAETAMIAPPTVELQIIQTADNFSMDEVVSSTNSDRTDRATLYLVPGKSENTARKTITANEVANTNNPQVVNLPFLVNCDNAGDDYVCSNIKIDLPEPFSGGRSSNTFVLALSLPYRQPETDFSIEFYCSTKGDNTDKVSRCGKVVGEDNGGEKQITLRDAQVDVDSTGRANDLFRRVEVRLETQDVSFPYPTYALQVLKNDSGYSLIKNMIVTCENSLYASANGFRWRNDGESCK